MKLLFEFVFLLCLICHTFGQESHSSHSNTNGSPENDHEGDTDHGHHTAGLKCFHCTFTQDAHGYKGDSDCQNPVEGKVNVTECSEDSSCGYWAGNLSIGFTVIRSCILHHTETSQCNEKVTIRDTIEYDLFNGSSPLSVEATEKVQGISESCGQNLCNNGTFRESCKVVPGGSGNASHDNHGIHTHPSIQANKTQTAAHGGQHGGNNSTGSTGINTVFQISFLLCNLFFLQISA